MYAGEMSSCYKSARKSVVERHRFIWNVAELSKMPLPKYLAASFAVEAVLMSFHLSVFVVITRNAVYGSRDLQRLSTRSTLCRASSTTGYTTGYFTEIQQSFFDKY